MAIPTITTDATLIHSMDNQTNLTAWGTNALSKWGNSSDIALENGISHALAPFATGDSGMGRQGLGGINLSTNRLFIWINVISPSFVGLSSGTPAGVYIRIVTNSTSGDWATDYLDFYVGGSDVAWVGSGWHLVALDCNRTADRSNGTTTLTNIDKVGVGFNVQSTASKSDVIAVDVMRYGTKMEVTGVTSSSATHNFNDNGGSDDTITRASGSFITDGMEAGDTIRVNGTTYNDGEYIIKSIAALTITLETGSLAQTETGVTSNVDAGITLESIYQKDGPTDDNWYGAVSKNRDGGYEINYKLIVGDESGSSRTFFVSRGDQIILADQPLSTSSAELQIITKEDTGNTIVVFGESSGTGDDRVGFNGSVISQDDTYTSGSGDGSALADLDFSTAIDEMEFFGCTVLSVNDGATFAADTSHLVTNTSFTSCGQVALGSVEARNMTFSGYADTSDAALLWNASIDIKNSRFLAITNSTGDRAAIEHDTAGSFTYTNLSFAGNDYDVENSSSATNADSYSDSNQDGEQAIGNGTVTAAGQSITGNGAVLANVELDLRKVGSPTGTAVVKIFAHTGTFGTDGTPTGSALATSETFNVADLTTTLALTKIDFEDQFTLVNTTKYFIVVEYSGGDSSNYLAWGYDGTSPGHGGNLAYYDGTWNDDNTKDMCFYCRTGGIVYITKATGSDPSSENNTGTIPGTIILYASFTYTVYGLELNTEVTIVLTGTTNVVHHTENATVSDGEGKYKITYSHSGGQAVDVLIHHASYEPDVSNIYDITLPSADSSSKVKMFTDLNYVNP